MKCKVQIEMNKNSFLIYTVHLQKLGEAPDHFPPSPGGNPPQ